MLHAPSTDLLHACSTKTLPRASPPAALTSLRTDGNPLKSPPADVLGLGAAAVVRFLAATRALLAENARDLYECFDADGSGSVSRQASAPRSLTRPTPRLRPWPSAPTSSTLGRGRSASPPGEGLSRHRGRAGAVG